MKNLLDIPIPEQKYAVRLPKDLLYALRTLARERGVATNDLMVKLLQTGVSLEANRLLEHLEVTKLRELRDLFFRVLEPAIDKRILERYEKASQIPPNGWPFRVEIMNDTEENDLEQKPIPKPEEPTPEEIKELWGLYPMKGWEPREE